MKLVINGEEKQLDGIKTILDMITQLDLDPRKVAIERNLEVVPRSLHGSTALSDGDRIEIVQFVGGG